MRAIGFAFLTAMLAGPVVAQDAGGDWDLRKDPQEQLTLATLNFGANQIALRCRAGVLDFLLTGVPTTDAALRPVRISAGAIRNEGQSWQTWSGRPIASPSEPERLARQLRAGGELDILLEPTQAGERPRRYRLPVPASATSVDEVLTACAFPLVDEWDLRPRADPDIPGWTRQPAPDFPDIALRRGVDSGETRLGCVVASEGALSECRIISETPAGAGFGPSALRAMERSRVRLPEDEGSVIGKVVSLTVRFRLS